MAMRWNWKKLGYGSGALVATLSTVFALSPSRDQEKCLENNKGTQAAFENDKRFQTKPDLATAGQKFAGFPIPAEIHKCKEQALHDSIEKSRSLCQRIKNEKGLPGLTIAVSINGKLVWQEGFGFANLENNVRMKAENIMRIASISKSMTMAMLAKLMEEGKIDIDQPIQTYLPNYPQKYVDGEKVTITTRHLLSHLSGIRHYEKKDGSANENNPKDDHVPSKDKKHNESSDKWEKKKKRKEEMSLDEYFLKDKFNSVEDAMKLFQDDELFHKPGTKFLYTTHGWTVVSAIIEKLTSTEFPKHSKLMFDYWGLKNTYLDLHDPIIYNRASYYTRMKDGLIQNAPYVDNSYKWAGGGFLSNVADLNQFAHILLYSWQAPESNLGTHNQSENGLSKAPFLKRSTIQTVWTGNPTTIRLEIPDFLYALGFQVGEPLRKCMFCKERDLMVVSHTGAAIGASSILLLAFPSVRKTSCDSNDSNEGRSEVTGVVVSMITNMTSVSLTSTANEIASIFRELI